MSDHFHRDDTGRCHTILSVANVYQFKGFTFEVHAYFGPSKVNKNGDPAARQGRKFWRVIDEWCQLSDEEKKATQIAG